MKQDLAICLRKFVAQDYAELISWVPTVNDFYLFSGTTEPWPLVEQDLAHRALNKDIRSWTAVLEPDEKPVGHIELVQTSTEVGRFARVMIEPGSRGRGLARLLVGAGIEAAKGLGLSRIDLNVVTGNDPAMRTYRSLGFRVLEGDPEHPAYLRMTRAID
ncbi:GNAT family N-acetyltransferase [Homoserinimonas sp. OAct 916]|uniref:GNAT family N-acetyltransferase n=1 Tax=Homoserinimonas sp. OAct 916 TaxID=2211450 RepID=UPI0013007291|nr:GNAT family N-acetyltransferase [Homoserinimonas sp. OAct 916]